MTFKYMFFFFLLPVYLTGIFSFLYDILFTLNVTVLTNSHFLQEMVNRHPCKDVMEETGAQEMCREETGASKE